MPPTATAFLRNVHTSRWGRAGGFGFGFGLGTLAIGSSTDTSWRFVQTTITSPLARAMLIGNGGTTTIERPGFFGRGTKEMSNVVVARSPSSLRETSGPAPPSGSGK